MRIEQYDTIESLEPGEWDRALGHRSSFSAAGLRLLERTFRPGGAPENDWTFRYYRVAGEAGRPKLLTFFTRALWKDDMLLPEEVSIDLERQRADDPYFMTSVVYGMGSLLTEGEHLYLDESLPAGERAALLEALVSRVLQDAMEHKARAVVLRDFADDDGVRDAQLARLGFEKSLAPESLALPVTWRDEGEYVAGLRSRHRREYRKHVVTHASDYSVDVVSACDPDRAAKIASLFHQLYLNVKERRLDLNTFPLPPEVFRGMAMDPAWEILVLRYRDEEAPCAMIGCCVGEEVYAPMVIGLDYRLVKPAGLYRQCLKQMIFRGQRLGKERVLLGMGGVTQKRQFGAMVDPRCMYARPLG
ncbi:MAG: GNAT family N-acetyltransferase [Proteobacteria bacterium]|nr:GNAT family N-acetyltransferase [Pseudomonadota bacterium]